MGTREERLNRKFEYLYKRYDLAFEDIDCGIKKLNLNFEDDYGSIIKVHRAIRAQRKEIKSYPSFDKDVNLQELNERLFFLNKEVMYLLEKQYNIVQFTVNDKGEECYVQAP